MRIPPTATLAAVLCWSVSDHPRAARRVKDIIKKKVLGAQFKESVDVKQLFRGGGKKRALTSFHVIVDVIGPKSTFEGMSEWDKLEDCLDTFGICNARINKVIDVAAEPTTSGRTRRPSILPVPAGLKRGNSMKKSNSAEQVVIFSPLFHEENLREFPGTIHSTADAQRPEI